MVCIDPEMVAVSEPESTFFKGNANAQVFTIYGRETLLFLGLVHPDLKCVPGGDLSLVFPQSS